VHTRLNQTIIDSLNITYGDLVTMKCIKSAQVERLSAGSLAVAVINTSFIKKRSMPTEQDRCSRH
jgi:hypothetical protein